MFSTICIHLAEVRLSKDPVSLLEDHSAENLPSHCLPFFLFTVCLASPSCLVLRHPWQEVKPGPAGSTALPVPCWWARGLLPGTEMADQSGWPQWKIPSSRIFCCCVQHSCAQKTHYASSTADACQLSPWTAESPSQYICVFYSWSPSVLVYFCSFIHVHPDEIPHFLFTPQQIRGWSLRRCACINQRGWVTEEQKGISTVYSGSSISKVPLKAAVWPASLGSCCWSAEAGLVFPCLFAFILGLLQTNAVRIRRLPWIFVKIPSPSPASCSISFPCFLFSSALTTFHLLSAFATTP